MESDECYSTFQHSSPFDKRIQSNNSPPSASSMNIYNFRGRQLCNVAVVQNVCVTLFSSNLKEIKNEFEIRFMICSHVLVRMILCLYD